MWYKFIGKYVFLILARSEKAAKRYAKQYHSIDTDAVAISNDLAPLLDHYSLAEKDFNGIACKWTADKKFCVFIERYKMPCSICVR